MVKRVLMAIALAGGLLLPAAEGDAQQPIGCPVAEEGDGPPIELRIGDFVLRAEVKSGVAEGGEGTRVEGRLVGCEYERRIPSEPGAAEAEPGTEAVAGFASALRLLHDLRVGLELAPGADGRCVRAKVDVADATSEAAGTAAERPVSVELCGLPIRIGRPSVQD
jgi:hypothetical protein